jgi:hypothetical protein
MNYLFLKTEIPKYTHRTDLGADIPRFADAARVRINQRFAAEYPALVSDTDTNDSLTANPNMWLYAALAEAFGFLHNGPAAETWDMRYQVESDKMNVTGPGTEPLAIGIYDGT